MNRLTSNGRRVVAIAIMLGLAVEHAPVARADDAEKPWVRGVSKERRAQAQALLERGNGEFLAKRYKEALALYEEALAVWDHPAIRFNAVRALVALDRAVAAQDNLEKALAYGADPLEDSVYREALNYQRLLAGTVGSLELRCTQAGVSVRVDGAVELACPGTKTIRMTPGKHAVSATGPGLLAQTIDAVVTPSKTERIAVQLAPLRALLSRQRWATWKPWTVSAVGVAAIGVGVVFRLKAGNEARAIEETVKDRCQASCTDDQFGLGATKSRLARDNAIWAGGVALGGAALVTGIALVILNRPTVHDVVPTVTRPTRDGVGLSFSGTF